MIMDAHACRHSRTNKPRADSTHLPSSFGDNVQGSAWRFVRKLKHYYRSILVQLFITAGNHMCALIPTQETWVQTYLLPSVDQDTISLVLASSTSSYLDGCTWGIKGRGPLQGGFFQQGARWSKTHASAKTLWVCRIPLTSCSKKEGVALPAPPASGCQAVFSFRMSSSRYCNLGSRKQGLCVSLGVTHALEGVRDQERLVLINRAEPCDLSAGVQMEEHTDVRQKRVSHPGLLLPAQTQRCLLLQC